MFIILLFCISVSLNDTPIVDFLKINKLKYIMLNY